jgi:hypothetical protein
MVHKHSDTCSNATYSQFCYWAIVVFYLNYALYHLVVNIMLYTTNFIIILITVVVVVVLYGLARYLHTGL